MAVEIEYSWNLLCYPTSDLLFKIDKVTTIIIIIIITFLHIS